MRNLRTFSQEFKRQVVEELMNGESRPRYSADGTTFHRALAHPSDKDASWGAKKWT